MNLINEQTSSVLALAKQMKKRGCVLQYLEDEEFNGRTIVINGKELLHFANCSYLGLETSEKVKERSYHATKYHGSQFSCSRALLSSPLYSELEDLLVKVFPGYHVVTPTTTLGHCSVMPVLIQENDAIILDTYVHNSVRMASNLCKANGTFVVLSRHNDFEHVKYLVYRLKKDGYKNIWYCADGVYSMHGDKLKIHELAQLLDEEDNLYAYVDDAHGVSWTGKNGSGYVLNEYGLHRKMIIAVSFAKSFAACGGALIFPNPDWANLVRVAGQTMIFSGPISPPILGALIGSVEIHLSDDLTRYQDEILELIKYFRMMCINMNLPLYTKDETPIQMLKAGGSKLTYGILEKLIKMGVFATAAVYPAVPEEDSGIRVTLTRHLKKQDIDKLLNGVKIILNEIPAISYNKKN